MSTSTQKILYALVLCCLGQSMAVAQQMIANPLVKPNQQRVDQESSVQTTKAEQVPPAEQVDLRRQAESKLGQEDFNLRQQRLNAPVLPAPLVGLLSNMHVTAVVQGAVVLRKLDTLSSTPNQQASSASTPSGGAGILTPPRDTGAANSNSSTTQLRSTSALRLRTGRPENINGYLLRAKVGTEDVVIEWLNEQGSWINVFFAALESTSTPQNNVPSSADLLTVETKQFDYLVPRLQSRTFTANSPQGGLNQGSNGFGQGFNTGGFGGGLSNNPQGFGSFTGF